MKPMHSHAAVLLTAMLSVAGNAKAADTEVTWQDAQNYTDIASNYGSQAKFQKALFNALDGVFAEQSARLPEGRTLSVTVTDFDMAGLMRTGYKGAYQRVVNQAQFPQMRLSYRLTDASGAVIAEQNDVLFQDLNFIDATNIVSQSELNEPFYYESGMVGKWFDNTFRLPDGHL